MKIFKFSVIFLCILFAIGFVIMATMIIRQNTVDILINDNINTLMHNVKYKNPAIITGVPVIKQKINCGYACIEMLSEYLGGNGLLTEEILFEKNGGKITASTNNGMYSEIKKRLPDYNITQYKNLKNSEMIDKIYDSLLNRMPVIFSYAALDDTAPDKAGARKWTLHYGMVTEMNIPGNKIAVVNPYGYIETYNLNDFLRASRFENYENMEFYLKLGFAAGVFSKNTVYITEDPLGYLK